jgi:hypothetical protein
MFSNYPFDPFNIDLSDTEFKLTFRPLTRAVMPWIDELSIAAEKYKSISKPLYLGLSGGIDSEVIARTFLKEKIDFIPLIIEYRHSDMVLNEHDIQYAKDFCKLNKLDALVHSVEADDLIKMAFDERYFPYYRVTSLYQYVQIYLVNLVEALNGFLVAGSGVQSWTYDRELKFKLYGFYLNVYEYMNDHNLVHWPSFFWTTPELNYAYMQTFVAQKAFEYPKKFKFMWYSEHVKRQIYHTYFPDLQKREKYHGYEKFSVVPAYKNLLTSIINYESSTTKITYNDFIRQFENPTLFV